uniref:Methylenetetrahydrofolate reductase (NAD(P)H) n=1 Tax=Timema cristinae TaxID=61476 RepID=A0A7R9CBP7_TIMCR|nr:unnamed protein product [Timema cristinae]
MFVDNGSKYKGGFAHAVDLVKFIRREFGDYFTICVAGYPLGHPEATSYQQDLIHLKEKVDAGANFIISQIVFNAVCFSQFVKDCRNIDIAVPILPGVMPVQSYKSLERTSSICHIPIPRAILDAVKPIEDNDDAVRNYGIHQAVQMIKEMFSLGCATGVHFFTLNR